MKKDLSKLNDVFSSVLSNVENQWTWEKQTPKVIVKSKFGSHKNIRVLHLGQLDYWAINDQKPIARYSSDQIIDARLIDKKTQDKIDEFDNKIAELRKQREQYLKDKMLELEIVDDEIIKKFYQKRKELFS